MSLNLATAFVALGERLITLDQPIKYANNSVGVRTDGTGWTHALVRNIADGTFLRSTVAAGNANSLTQFVYDDAQVILGANTNVHFVTAFRGSDLLNSALLHGLVVNGDTSLVGGANFVANLLAFTKANGSRRLNLQYARNASAGDFAGGYRTIDTGVDLLDNRWYLAAFDITTSETGTATGSIRIGSGTTLGAAAQGSEHVRSVDLDRVPDTVPLTKAMAWVEGNALGKTFDHLLIGDSVSPLPITRQ